MSACPRWPREHARLERIRTRFANLNGAVDIQYDPEIPAWFCFYVGDNQFALPCTYRPVHMTQAVARTKARTACERSDPL